MRQTSIHGMTNAGAFLLSITKIAQMCGGPLGMDDIMLASVKSAAFGGGSYIVISYFDYVEERVLGERPACVFPPARVPEAAGPTGKEQASDPLPSVPVLGPLRAVGGPLAPRPYAVALLVPMGLPIHLLSGKKGRSSPWGPSEQPDAQASSQMHLRAPLQAAAETGREGPSRASPDAGSSSSAQSVGTGRGLCFKGNLVVIGDVRLLYFPPSTKGLKCTCSATSNRPGWLELLFPDKSIPGSHPPRSEREAAD